MSATKKAVKAVKAKQASDTMIKCLAPKWSRDTKKDLNAMAKKGGYVATAKDKALEDRTSICFEGIRMVSSGDKDYLIQHIWYRGYKLAVVIGRMKKARKSNNGLAVAYIVQRSLDEIPKGYEKELSYLFEDQTQEGFCQQAEVTLRMNKIAI